MTATKKPAPTTTTSKHQVACDPAPTSEPYPRFSMQRSVQDIHEITMSTAGAAGANLLPAEPVPAGVWTPKQAA